MITVARISVYLVAEGQGGVHKDSIPMWPTGWCAQGQHSNVAKHCMARLYINNGQYRAKPPFYEHVIKHPSNEGLTRHRITVIRHCTDHEQHAAQADLHQDLSFTKLHSPHVSNC